MTWLERGDGLPSRGHRPQALSLHGSIINIASAWPWAERIPAGGSSGSDCKIRGCRRSPPARTFRRLAANWRRQARDRLPLDQLGALRLGLHRRLDVLDHGLKLLVRQLFEWVLVLDLVLAGHKQSEDLEI